jgi:acetyltransferase-like isoleucine patch superfamily enzyme
MTAKILFPDLVNIYDCEIGANTVVGPFVEIQRGAKIGARCKIQSHTFICAGVTIEDDVFVGHGVMFTNDRYPDAKNHSVVEKTLVKEGATIGSGSTILSGIVIGARALIGAGSVVTKDVDSFQIVAGNPAKGLEKRSFPQ